MKVAVAADGSTLESRVAKCFGKCSEFIFVDADSLEFDSVANPGLGVNEGAGEASALLVKSRGANVVLTGEIGPNAVHPLLEAGIAVYVWANVTAREAVEKFRVGKFPRAFRGTVEQGFGKTLK